MGQSSEELWVTLMNRNEMTVLLHQLQHIVVFLRVLRVKSLKSYLGEAK
jgi:hypothetical protein